MGRTSSAEPAEEPFAIVLESVSDAAVVVDADGCIVQCNPPTEWPFGYPRHELVGRPVSTLLPVRRRDATAGSLQLWGCRKDGSGLPVDITLSQVRTGTGSLTVATIRGISEP